MKKTHKILPGYSKLCVFTAFVLLFIANCSLLCQITWQRTYRPIQDGDEEAYGMCSADSSNFYVVGLTAPFFRNVYILKLNQFGDTIWTRILSSGQAVKVAPVNDGGCVYIGYNGNTGLMGRLSPNGLEVWQRSLSQISLYDIIQLSDNEFLICGENTNSANPGGYLNKIDSLGNTLWSKTYEIGNRLTFTVIKKNFINGYILGGSKIDSGGSIRNGYVSSINDTGFVNWQRSYSVIPFVSDIAVRQNGYILTGISNYKVMLMKINMFGDSTNSKIFQNTNNVYSINLLLTSPNKCYVAHSNDPYGKVFSVDSNLKIIKELILQPTQFTCALYAVISAPNSISSDILCSGLTAVISEGNSDVFVARIDSSLNQPPPIGLKIYSNSLPKNYNLEQNYPNPFNPKTIIKYDLPIDGLVTIKIYDILGKAAGTMSEFKKAGSYEYGFDGSNFASGLYFYRIEAGSFVETKKMVLIK